MQSNLHSYKEYLFKEKKYSSNTITAYVNDVVTFEKFMSELDNQYTLETASYSLVRNWVVHLLESGLENKSVNRKISSLKSFYKFLLKIKQISSTPLLKHKSLKVSKVIQIPFSEKEINLAIDKEYSYTTFEEIRNYLIVTLFYTTGMRRAELISLQLKSIDFSNKAIKVIGKRNKERIIPLLPFVIQLLKNYISFRIDLQTIKDSEVLILSNKGNKVSESFVYRLINDYFSTASIKVKKSPHILRHTFATHLLNNGADLNSVKELLGHASLASTQVYTHSSLNELKNVYKNAHPRNKE
jgi:integrase/recombinase XerC